MASSSSGQVCVRPNARKYCRSGDSKHEVPASSAEKSAGRQIARTGMRHARSQCCKGPTTSEIMVERIAISRESVRAGPELSREVTGGRRTSATRRAGRQVETQAMATGSRAITISGAIGRARPRPLRASVRIRIGAPFIRPNSARQGGARDDDKEPIDTSIARPLSQARIARQQEGFRERLSRASVISPMSSVGTT